MKVLIKVISLFLITIIGTYNINFEHIIAADGATFTSKSLKISETENLNYWLFTPKNATEDMPLIIYLHGGSGKGDDINKLTENGFCKWVYEGKFDNVPAYIIFPQLSSDYNGWTNAKTNIKSLIDITVKQFSINRNKISLTGHSMGGTGTFAIGAAYPELFSCIAPMSGSVTNNDKNINAIKVMPIWAFVGSADNIVSPESSIEFVDSLKKSGADAKITIFNGATHFDIPELAYLDENLDVIGWLINNQKENKIKNVENGIVSVKLKQAGTYTLIFVDYDKGGKLNNTKFLTTEMKYGNNEFSIPNNILLETNDKIMLWESIKTMTPLCDVYTFIGN